MEVVTAIAIAIATTSHQDIHTYLNSISLAGGASWCIEILHLLTLILHLAPIINGTCITAFAPKLPIGFPSNIKVFMDLFSINPTHIQNVDVDSKLLLLTCECKYECKCGHECRVQIQLKCVVQSVNIHGIK